MTSAGEGSLAEIWFRQEQNSWGMVMSEKYIVGFDMGTGSVRVGVYKLDGHEIGFAATEYETIHEHPGWAEQRPLLEAEGVEFKSNGNVDMSRFRYDPGRHYHEENSGDRNR